MKATSGSLHLPFVRFPKDCNFTFGEREGKAMGNLDGEDVYKGSLLVEKARSGYIIGSDVDYTLDSRHETPSAEELENRREVRARAEALGAFFLVSARTTELMLTSGS